MEGNCPVSKPSLHCLTSAAKTFHVYGDSELRHLGRACPKHFCCPFCAWQIGGKERLQFLLDVLLDPANRRSTVVEKQVAGTGISVVREAHASSVDQEFGPPSDLTNEGAMCMPEGHDGLA